MRICRIAAFVACGLRLTATHVTIFHVIALCVALCGSNAAFGQNSSQRQPYAVECYTAVDNATVHISPDSSGEDGQKGPTLPGKEPLAKGDTIALYNRNGRCVGYGVWTEANGATLAAAGKDTIPHTPPGYAEDNPLRMEVFDKSEETVVNVGKEVTYAPCEKVDVPVCREGRYKDGSFHVAVGLDTSSSSSSPPEDPPPEDPLPEDTTEGDGPVPDRFFLGAPSPNPTSRRVSVTYKLPSTAQVSIRAYNLLGKQVRRLVDAEKEPGTHRLSFSTKRMASGKYFVRMRAEANFKSVRTFVVIQ